MHTKVRIHLKRREADMYIYAVCNTTNVGAKKCARESSVWYAI